MGQRTFPIPPVRSPWRVNIELPQKHAELQDEFRKAIECLKLHKGHSQTDGVLLFIINTDIKKICLVAIVGVFGLNPSVGVAFYLFYSPPKIYSAVADSGLFPAIAPSCGLT